MKYYEQRVGKGLQFVPVAVPGPLTALGQGPSVQVTLPTGVHMIVAYALDARGRILAVDEIAVAVR